jgi:hypothetical protein
MEKINASFPNEMPHIWKQCKDKISKMKEKYHEEHGVCNATSAPPSS